jgi:predicted metalloprotease
MTIVSATDGNRGHAAVVRTTVIVLIIAGALLTGCTRAIAGRPVAAPEGVGLETDLHSLTPGSAELPETPPAQVRGSTGSASDRLAQTVVTSVERYWRERFPTEFGRRWVNIHGYYAASPKDADAQTPCIRQPTDLTNQALYCPRLDTVAWDRDGLVPQLRANFGDGAVVVALAHEIGHAVQERLGVNLATQLREPDRYPTILLEAMADCFAGVVVRAGADGKLASITISPNDLDRALSALLSFRDPVGMTAGAGAHGDAFDRASAFIDGYRNGPANCARMSTRNQTFTQRGFTSLADAARGGNLPLGELLSTMAPDARAWFSQLVTARGRPWQAPALATSAARCPSPGVRSQGPVQFCPGNGALSAYSGELRTVHAARGDYASGTLVASRYALAAVAALGRQVQGAEAGRAAVCLTGAYTRALFDRHSGFGLSPGDIDEAVDELISQDFAARDAVGQPPTGDRGFSRIEQFRAGALGGPAKCGI